MPARTPIRNRLAKPLPERWRTILVEHGVPKRKYTAICAMTFEDGSRFDDVVIEEGWIISTSASGLSNTFEERIELDPGQIVSITVKQVI